MRTGGIARTSPTTAAPACPTRRVKAVTIKTRLRREEAALRRIALAREG
jgi:hypothetical protein